MNLENWPPFAGRYYVGNKKSPVAVCTLASIDLLERMKDRLDNIAIVGKLVTENIGIERIIQNTITNQNIRFLILCGRESRGHFVAQTIESLINNGVDEKNKIIGAIGPLPILKNLSRESIEIFRNQIKVINMVGCEDVDEILKCVNECIKNNPGTFLANVKLDEVKTISADYDYQKEFSADERMDDGWFSISIDKNRKLIVVEYYKGFGEQARLNCRIVGKKAEEIAGTITKMKLISGVYHGAYLGKELQKAELAIKYNLEYEQDKELDFGERIRTY